MTTNSLRLNRYGHLLTQYLKPLRLKVALLAVLLFSTIGLQLLNPQIIRIFIDQALAKAEPQTLLWAALASLGSSLLLHGINLAATYLSEDVGWRATNQLRTDLALHCLHLDMRFHHAHTPGEMVERIDGDVAELANFFAQFVRANLLLGLPEEKVNLAQAIDAAVLEPDLLTLENSLDSLIGPKGVKLSGGQIQRVAAARMFLRTPELLVFDDLSSALDVETEQLLWTQLFGRDELPTCLVVSHRRAALQRADRIIVLKDGKVEDQGRLAELLGRCTEMRRLWQDADNP